MHTGVTLSESESKLLLTPYGLPTIDERVVASPAAAVEAAQVLGYPVVAKLEGEAIAHKTERGLVRLDLADAAAVSAAATELLAAARPDDGEVGVLVAPMIRGNRELIVGLLRDEQFGPTVMLGLGGILAEAIADVVFRPAPLDEITALEMIDGLATQRLLGDFRGEAAVDRDAVAALLVGLGRLALDRPDVASVDVNPLIVTPSGAPVAVDALVEIGEPTGAAHGAVRPRPSDDAFRALFDPKGVLITGASTHPGKFGFVSLHNLLASGYEGGVYATNLQAELVLGIQTVADIDALPDDAIDLVFVCTPAKTNPDILRACAAKGIRAAFLTSAGYGEAGEAGKVAERELVELADELGILLAGPNGQGVVSTPANLCAQIVAPFPPAGRIGVASQSGNFVSSFLNLARSSGVGVSRAVSAGNAAAVGVADYLDFYADDDATSVGLAYVEGITDGEGLMRRLGRGGGSQAARAAEGRRHRRRCPGGCQPHRCAGRRRQGVRRSLSRQRHHAGGKRRGGVRDRRHVRHAAAAQGPRRRGVDDRRRMGGGDRRRDHRDPDLRLLELPDDLLAAIDEHLPPRWSRNNPVDCAGGETRDTIPTVMGLIAEHPAVDAIVYIGLGIQSNQARMMREGGFFPDHGLDRIVEYHERQDRRFAEAAAELSERTGKPILAATELAVADPDNPGPAALRATGRLCYPSGDRAVAALGHLYRYARHRERRSA